jgi:hypothetical protein
LKFVFHMAIVIYGIQLFNRIDSNVCNN